eukprot:TRINITY_DN4044_c0_g1_i5.p1 TRINITY_DN4044_c0_g1~~TRINITY_DN4044_c0_g1_i5.p1  ORF type:complete len:512 (-),score=104.96 TRINITY_DN4044_c0_g1_i5:151-1563(-)
MDEILMNVDIQAQAKPEKIICFPPVPPVKQPPVSTQAVIRKVMGMVNDDYARSLAGRHGLDIVNVTWEDNARSKNSSWGPCISDMTLMVEENRMPVIRYPNFTDLTWDVPMEKIPLIVGNETGGPLYAINLREYLENFRMYLNDSTQLNWKGKNNSLLAPSRDSHAIMSSQACFLPVPQSGEAKFNVGIFNYQSSRGNPAVLSIVATINGTSAQIVDTNNKKLYFNKKGERASFLAVRLSDHRKEMGKLTSGPMTSEEKKQNMIMIIQVPLKVRQQFFYGYSTSLVYDDFCEGYAPASAPLSSAFSSFATRREKSNVEDAIIKVGETEGKFSEIDGMEIERDENFPVRVTLQYYKTTDNGVVDEDVIKTIADQLKDSRKNADAIGSLVVAGQTGRPTEALSLSVVPKWWGIYWLTYSPLFSGLTEAEAKSILFTDSRYQNSEMGKVESMVTKILQAHVNQKSGPTSLTWL